MNTLKKTEKTKYVSPDTEVVQLRSSDIMTVSLPDDPYAENDEAFND